MQKMPKFPPGLQPKNVETGHHHAVNKAHSGQQKPAASGEMQHLRRNRAIAQQEAQVLRAQKRHLYDKVAALEAEVACKDDLLRSNKQAAQRKENKLAEEVAAIKCQLETARQEAAAFQSALLAFKASKEGATGRVGMALLAAALFTPLAILAAVEDTVEVGMGAMEAFLGMVPLAGGALSTLLAGTRRDDGACLPVRALRGGVRMAYGWAGAIVGVGQAALGVLQA